MNDLTNLERQDLLLILQAFGPLRSDVLTAWYNRAFRGRRDLSPEAVEAWLRKEATG